ncbi:MAG: 30S ribosomal protein S17 [Betaproteobacteria bacterium]|jgi:small subunit ribosomal protein S17|nr:MAG: 30S ribosomal protein S17 [Betaproteobacteria bacterium]
MSETTETPRRRRLTGRVVADKMDKTVTVRVDRMVRHPLYGKFVRRTTKYHAHDEANECHTGDTVLIEESRPYSKSKTWKVARLMERATKV